MTPGQQLKRMEALQAEMVDLRKSLSTTVEGALAAMPEKLRAQRKRLGLTQDQLAQRIGVSRTQLVNLEAGRSNITIQRFARFCVALGASADDLLGLGAVGVGAPHRGAGRWVVRKADEEAGSRDGESARTETGGGGDFKTFAGT